MQCLLITSTGMQISRHSGRFDCNKWTKWLRLSAFVAMDLRGFVGCTWEKAQKVKLKMKHMMCYVPCWNLHRCGVDPRFPNHFPIQKHHWVSTNLRVYLYPVVCPKFLFQQEDAETRSHKASVTVLGRNSNLFQAGKASLGILRVLMIFRDLPQKYANIW